SYECGGSYEGGILQNKAEMNFKSSYQEDDFHLFHSEGSARAKNGLDGSTLDAKIGTSVFRAYDEDAGVDLKFLSAAAKAKAGVDMDGVSASVKAGLNLAEAEVAGFKSRIGVNADTGVSIGKSGIETKVAGVGFKLGR